MDQPKLKRKLSKKRKKTFSGTEIFPHVFFHKLKIWEGGSLSFNNLGQVLLDIGFIAP